MLLTGSKDGHVRIWDLATQHCFQTLAGTQGEVCLYCVSLCAQHMSEGSPYCMHWWGCSTLSPARMPVSTTWIHHIYSASD